MEPREQEQRPPLYHLPALGASVNVLLIEDDESYAGLVTILLSANPDQECQVTVASSLREGMEKLASDQDFDAVLLDLNLPDSRGLDTLLQLMNAFPGRSVIVLTGTNDREQGVSAVGAGAQDYLVKGEFEPNQLARVLRFSMERKHILSRLEEAQQIAKIGNWELRPQQAYFSASKEVYHILGLDPIKEVFSYKDLSEESCPLHIIYQQQTREAKAHNSVLELNKKTGPLQYIQLNSRQLNDKEDHPYLVGTLQDVTLQKRTEELQRNQELAEETARVREQVIANVSHELRTPMNAIVGMSHLLVNSPMNEEQQECLSAIQDASQLLLGIINDILLTSSLQNGEIELHSDPFDLPLTVRRIIEVLLPRARAKNISLDYQLDQPMPQRIVGDKQRLSQVLYNIIGNAVKFTEVGSVHLTIQQRRQEGNTVLLEFSVQDTGPGIPETKQEEIFLAFNRIRRPGKNTEGTGLGLSISKQLVLQMGGTMSLQSTLGAGATFSFILPFDVTAAPVETTALSVETIMPTTAEKIKPQRILIVEDHRMNQIVLEKTLLQQYPNLEVVVVASGEEALEFLPNQHFDMIFMDIQLPGMDGFQTTIEMRKILMSEQRSTPVLAMTAQAEIAQDEQYRSVGMNDYILKPFNPEELFRKINQHLL